MRRDYLVAVVIGGVVLFAMTAGGVFVLCLLIVPPNRQAAGTRSPDPRHDRMTREEFRAFVKGKTTREVHDLCGPPSRTSDSPKPPDDPDYYGTWTYTNLRVYDPVSAREEWSVEVVFAKGAVDRVRYN